MNARMPFFDLKTFFLIVSVVSTSAGKASPECPPDGCQTGQKCCGQAGCCFECCGDQCCPLQPQKMETYEEYESYHNLIIILGVVSFLVIISCAVGFFCWRLKLYKRFCCKDTTVVTRRPPENVPMLPPSYVYGQTTSPAPIAEVSEKEEKAEGAPTYTYPAQKFG